MAPDRGYEALESSSYLSGFHRSVLASDDVHAPGRDRTKSSGFEYPTPEGESFTIRGIAVGLVVGILICFSNTFFGLQTGWVSGMTMPASLVGFAFFRAAASHLNFPFSPVENVLVQTVAGAVGTMPLGSGFVGVVPALEYLLKPSENGPLKLSLGNLVLWSLGLSFFGVVFGVPLRKQVIIKEKLKFPSGTATALMIRVLHGEGKDDDAATREDRRSDRLGEDAEDEPVLQGVVIDDKHRVPDSDAPPEQLVGMRTVVIGLVASLLFCVLTIRLVFGSLVPIYATLIAVLMALLLSVMGVRALGETDLNPVSGISKLTQLLFALVVPRRHPNAIIINLVAGAVSEAGALQAGDMLQDLKTGHLVHASPKAQFYGQLIGSLVGAVASALVYKLYTSVYAVPGELFQVPTAYVWIFTARLVTGHGLPPMAAQWALGAAVLFVATSILRTVGVDRSWQAFVPGGIAVAVGMYNTPSFTLARAVGGLISWYWLSHRKRPETSLIIFASGLILGEGVVSIVNLVLASVGVRPLMSS
ncbi:MAG: hypothetical protein M1826_002151 [Phylliscum demangeonii]|nr:MAG: hypothetical protein M1826_002151 [Phylliscum demangeonii]